MKANSALAPLVGQLYNDLKKIAANYLKRERQNHTLQATALVHEAYLQLSQQPNFQWQNKTHFVAVSALAMRRILVDYARRHAADKRPGNKEHISITLPQMELTAAAINIDLLDLEQALAKLEAIDPDKARLVELRFFGGLSIAETAALLDISVPTVNRQWQRTKAWLYRELKA